MSITLMLINTKILGYSLYWKMYIQYLMVSDVINHFLFFISVNHFFCLVHLNSPAVKQINLINKKTA